MKKLICSLLGLLLICGSIFAVPMLGAAKTVDPDELLYDGGFEATASVAAAPKATDYAATHIWYRVNGTGALFTEDNGNVCFPTIGYLHQGVALENAKDYTLSFKVKKAPDATGAETELDAYICKTTARGNSTPSGLKALKVTPTESWVEYKIEFTGVVIETGTAYAVRMYDLKAMNASKANLLLDDISLKVKAVDDGNLLFDGTFDKTAEIAAAESYTTVTYASAHKWYMPASNSNVIAEGDNKVLNLKNWAYQSVAVEANQPYTLQFDAKTTSAAANVVAHLRALKNRGFTLVKSNVKALTADGEWHSYSLTLNVPAFSADYADYTLGLQATAGTEVLLDNIALKKLEGFTVEAAVKGTGGSAQASASVAQNGEKITFTATPAADYVFVGWFRDNETVAVSTNAIFETAITENTKLYAQFLYDASDTDELLYDGTFNRTTTVRGAESYTTVTYASAHCWYTPSSQTAVTTDGANPVLNLKTWVYQSVKINADKFYQLNFKAKTTSADTYLVAYLRSLKDRGTTLLKSEQTFITADGAWHEYSIYLKTSALLAEHPEYVLGLQAKEKTEMLLDDISMKELTGEIYQVSTRTYRGGKATVSAGMVSAGGTATFTATPDNGCTFIGWYVVGYSYEGTVSTEPVFTTAITGDVTLLAVFGGEKYPEETYQYANPGAETGNTDGWYTQSDGLTLSAVTGVGHSGKYCFKATPTAVTQQFGTTEPILLKGGYRYTYTCWVKNDGDARVRLCAYTGKKYIQGNNDLVYEDRNVRDEVRVTHMVGTEYTEQRGYASLVLRNSTSSYKGADEETGWVKYTMTFVWESKYDDTLCYFGIRNQSGIESFYMDDLSITEEKVDFNAHAYENSYCEWLYNDLKNPSFEQADLQTDYGTLPQGFTRQTGNAANGSSYLNIAANAGAYVKKITLKPRTWYVLGWDARTAVGGSSYITMTTVNPTADLSALQNPEALDISTLSFTASADWQRRALTFYTQNQSEVYMIIYGGSNAVQLDDLRLFRDKYAKETDPNVPAVKDTYDYDGNGITFDAIDLQYGNSAATAINGSNPGTGAGTAAPLLAVCISLLAALCLPLIRLKKKGGHCDER